MSWKLRPFIMAVLAACFLSGMLTAQRAYAVNQITMYIHAGTAAGTATTFCGWHGACTSKDTGGNALDWAQGGGTGVYFTSYAFHTGYATIAGTGKAKANNTGSCTRTTVDVKRPNGTTLGPVHFTHQSLYSSSVFSIVASSSPLYYFQAFTQFRVATTMSTELASCTNPPPPAPPLWTGAHLHEYAGSPFGTNWMRYPYRPGSEPNVDVTSITAYTHYVTFQY